MTHIHAIMEKAFNAGTGDDNRRSNAQYTLVKVAGMIFVEDCRPEQLRFIAKQNDAPRLREKIATETKWDGDVLRWKSNSAVVPVHVFEDCGLHAMKPQREAYEDETAKAIKSYVASQEDLDEEAYAEQMYEARAAFGPDVEVVNVFTGKRYTT